ncbi:MAG: 4-deoxy-4-formamido-L-arabinose-phosphoundecaprenol deformylase [Deltaproteobacteria bacterium]|nr:4-deoxy-4-formamido-L-arabinose-phosphoundecaprenol deformylase [Deltaproteobacteria bacterium]
MSAERILGLKIDVDTRRGMEEGVPALLSALSSAGVPATFFLSFGPDNSGKAVYRMLRSPRFLFKMIRTNAPGLYGMKTALYGTLLQAPMIAKAFPGLCREIEARGHEVEFHAWDHRTWQDALPRKGDRWGRDWFDQGLSAYRECLGHSPRAFGAPAWMLTGAAVTVLSAYPWEYLSCTRAPTPFLLKGTGKVELPSDLPCLEEVGGARGAGRILSALSSGGIHVLPVHAEVEGGIWRGAFTDMLQGASRLGYRVAPLSEIARILAARTLPERVFAMALLPGRACRCAV